MLVFYNSKLKDEDVPYSYRVRAELPSSKIKDSRVTDDLNSITTNDVAVLNKKVKIEEVNFITEKNIPFIFDISDNKWPLLQKELNYTSKRAKVVTTTCLALSDVIRDNTGRKSIVIPDPTEREEEVAKFEVTENNLVVYYGSNGNYINLDWDSIRDKLNNIHKTNLQIITNIPKQILPAKMLPYREVYQKADENGKIKIALKIQEDFKKLIPWSFEKQAELVRQSSLVLLPTSSKNKNMMRCKGNNRPVDALRMGRFVITSKGVPSYDLLKEFVFIGELDEGYKWALNNKEEVLDKIKKGQKFVRENYELNIIGKKWEKVYEDIISNIL